MFIITRFTSVILGVWRLVAILTNKRLDFKSFSAIAKEQDIPIFKTKNINDEKTDVFMKNLNVNILVSAYNNQILKYEVCKKFPHRGINIHNSYLPDFGGLDSAFQTIYHGVKQSGATVHYVDRNIDTGKILAQELIAVYPYDTIFSLNVRQWMRGARILPRVLEAIKCGTAESQKQDLNNIQYPYKSFPERKCVKELLKRRKRMISLKDFFVPSAYIYGLFGRKKVGHTKK